MILMIAGAQVNDALKRRHLSESQRAMVAATLANMRQGERTDLEPSENLPKVSQAQAAELLHVSERGVLSGQRVIITDRFTMPHPAARVI